MDVDTLVATVSSPPNQSQNSSQSPDVKYGPIAVRKDGKSAVKPRVINRIQTMHECDQCSRLFLSNETLLNHSRIHNRQPVGKKKLRKNENVKPLKVSAQTHRGRRDKTSRIIKRVPVMYNCEQCPQQFTSKVRLTVHSKGHTREIVSKRQEVVNRLKLSSLAVSRLVCDVCLKTFRDTEVLQTHMHTHTGVKPFMCELCGMAFTDKSVMRRHVDRHKQVKKFPCPCCHRRSFKLRSNLDTHLFKEHPSYQPTQDQSTQDLHRRLRMRARFIQAVKCNFYRQLGSINSKEDDVADELPASMPSETRHTSLIDAIKRNHLAELPPGEEEQHSAGGDPDTDGSDHVSELPPGEEEQHSTGCDPDNDGSDHVSELPPGEEEQHSTCGDPDTDGFDHLPEHPPGEGGEHSTGIDPNTDGFDHLCESPPGEDELKSAVEASLQTVT